MGFEDLQQQVTQGAEWTQTPKTRAFLGVTGKFKDLEFDKLRDGMNVAFVHRAPEDALEYVGRDSMLPKAPGATQGAPGETLGTLRGRLDVRWDTHYWSGTETAVKTALKALGLTNVEVYEDHEGIFAGGEHYSRFWVVARPPLPFSFLTMPFTMPVSMGTTATGEFVRRVKSDVLYWKSSCGYPVDVIVWDGTGTLLGISPFPFVMGEPSVVRWRIGKLLGDFAMPFVLGGYET